MTSRVDTPAGQERTHGSGEEVHPSLDDRLRAEAVRVIEGEDPQREPTADDAARRHDGDFEARLLVRARHLSIAPELDRAVGTLRAGMAWAVVGGLAAAFLLGALSVRATMAGADGARINFYWVLGAVLGVQTLLLVVWLGVAGRWSMRRASARRGSPMLISLGRLVVGAGRWVAEKVGAERRSRAAIQAAARVHGSGRVGVWTFSSITHALWLAFNVGALTLLLLLLSARQYTFIWETTILAEDQYIAMTEALNAPAAAVGFTVPTREDIVASQWTGDPGPAVAPGPMERSRRWASLLVASIVLYGAGPRLLLLVLSLGLRGRAARAFRLDVTAPEYQRLRPALMPATRPLGVVDPEAPPETGADPDLPDTATTRRRAPGPPAVVGVEMAEPSTGWPPTLGDLDLHDIGIIESRDDRARVIRWLEEADSEPRPLVIVCDLTGTPDRGVGRVIRSLRGTVEASPALVLTGGQALRRRGYDAEGVRQRVEDWRTLAAGSGVDPDAVVEADLDHLTDAAVGRLADQLTGNGGGQREGESPMRKAFRCIEAHAARWMERGRPPTEDDQLALHREIATLYRTGSGETPPVFRALLDGSNDTLRQATEGATRMVDLLPDRLRASPRWLGAGALAGAFGCLATSALAGPAAIAALPSWSAVGAAVAAALERRGTGEASAPPLPDSAATGDAVRAAALFTVTLELQQEDEATISRTLDRTFPEEEAAPGPVGPGETAGQLSEWLEEVRRRFHRAREEEVPS